MSELRIDTENIIVAKINTKAKDNVNRTFKEILFKATCEFDANSFEENLKKQNLKTYNQLQK